MVLRLLLQKREKQTSRHIIDGMMSSMSSSMLPRGGGGGAEIMRRRREYKVPDVSTEERISISNNAFNRYTTTDGTTETGDKRRAGGVGIVWFRNDLRILDNEVLNKAWARSSSLIPVYCMDPRIFNGTTRYFGFPKTGDMRARFLMECLADLKMNLMKRGLDLLVRHGKPEEVIPSIAEAFATRDATAGTVVVYAQKETCSEEVRVEQLVHQGLTCKQQQLQQQSSSSVSDNPPFRIMLELIWGGLTMYHIDDLPFSPSDLPDVYTQFRKHIESKCRVRRCCKLPQSLGPPASVSMKEVGGWGTIIITPSQQQHAAEQDSPHQGLNFIGGETAALARLYEYFWKKDLIKVYKETRNGMVGSDYSTKFSPWLASGCLSPRYIYEEVKRYEKERLANDSTYWVLFELMWRDYFRFISIKYGTSIFHLGGPRKVISKWSQDQVLFESWRDGQTGYPLIDANMKELSTTGFMSNRGRQIVCSFLVRDMGIDWRMGAEWFETCLLDYDPCSNYGNWTYGAGVGNDPREDRYFSIPKQAKNYDPEGDYVSFWLPQLKSLPKERRNFPGEHSYIKQVVPLKFDNRSTQRSSDYSSKASTSNTSRKYRRGKNEHQN